MPNLETRELQSYLDVLLDKTRQGLFEWTNLNPTTYAWSDSSARLTLQKIEDVDPSIESGKFRLRRRRSYLLQAFELGPNGKASERFKLNSGEDQAINQRLESLYDTISSGVSFKGLRFFESIVERE